MSFISSYHEQAAAKAAQMAQAARDTERELLANPAVAALLADYDPASVANFLRNYAARRGAWLEDGPKRVAHQQQEQLKYDTQAYERLWDIQHKKLFNIQCQWRAGLLRLPEVQVADQFYFWGHRPDHCPTTVLPPVTPDEVAVYQDYLASAACDDIGFRNSLRLDACEWQDVAAMRPDSPAHESCLRPLAYPAWYRYYDEHYNTGHLLHLTDTRFEQQQFYERLAYEEEARLNPRARFEEDTRPCHYDGDRNAQFEEFSRRFDPTPHLIDLHRLHRASTWEHPDHDEAFMASMLLAEEGGYLPLTEAYPDWRPALIALANDIRRAHLHAAMPGAFARYSLCLASGIRPPKPTIHCLEEEENPIALIHQRERVLRGRELNGEPRDFDF